MDIMEAMRTRHSVRQYEKKPLTKEIISELQAEIDACNQESGLHIQLVTGEPRVLKAQQMGLNTCWVAMTFSKIKSAYTLDAGEKLCIVIALGYGKNQGVSHKSKPLTEVTKAVNPPRWFLEGAKAALLAPTAMNQQKFTFSLEGNRVTAKAGLGFYSKIDLGIARYHFEIGAGKENFQWQ